MEHWLAVGLDIWSFIKWPLVCGLWFAVGTSFKSFRGQDYAPSTLGLAVFVTIIVANT